MAEKTMTKGDFYVHSDLIKTPRVHESWFCCCLLGKRLKLHLGSSAVGISKGESQQHPKLFVHKCVCVFQGVVLVRLRSKNSQPFSSWLVGGGAQRR